MTIMSTDENQFTKDWYLACIEEEAKTGKVFDGIPMWQLSDGEWTSIHPSCPVTHALPSLEVITEEPREEPREVPREEPREVPLEEPARTETGALTSAGAAELLEKIELFGTKIDIAFTRGSYMFRTDGTFVAVSFNRSSTVVCLKWLTHYLTPKHARPKTLECSCGEPHRHDQGQHRSEVYGTLPCGNGTACWSKKCTFSHFVPLATPKPSVLSSLTLDLASA